MVETVCQDVRYAVRSLVRRPLVTAVAVASLALGIGVNTAIFSVFERLLLRPLPVASPREVVNVTSPGPRPGSVSSDGDNADVFSYPLFRDLENLHAPALSRIAGYSGFDANVSFAGHTGSAQGLLVSGAYFPLLGVGPALGRMLTPDDDRIAGAGNAVVLSHAYWTADFGADPSVIGRPVTVNGVPLTIVGVAVQRFTGTRAMQAPQLFVPLALAATMRRASAGIDHRNDHWLYVVARLAPGVTRNQAERQVNVPFAHLIRDVEFPVQRSGMGDRAREAFLARRIVLQDGSRGANPSRQQYRSLLSMMLTVTGFVLLIACANVANLLLAKAATRAAEISIRLAIGASAARLVRLLLTEALLLGLAGALSAFIVAKGVVQALLRLLPTKEQPLLAIEFDGTIVAFTVVLGLGAALLFGLLPAVQALRSQTRPGVGTAAGRYSAPRTTARLRTALGITQVALSTALLALALVFIVSLINVLQTDLGLHPDGVITFRIAPLLSGYSPERAAALLARLEDELRGDSGFTGVSASTNPVLADAAWNNNVTVEGFSAGADDNTRANTARVGADYVRTLAIPLLAGRDLNEKDTLDAPKVAVVNEAFARKFHLGSEAVGKRMALGAGGIRPLDIHIVGVMKDAAYSHVRDTPPPQFFMPYRQLDPARAPISTLTFYVRTSLPLAVVRESVTRIVRGMDPNLPIDTFRTLPDQILENITPERLLAALASALAGVATVLAGIGLYAVLAFTVVQRVREIGVRMAVGARPSDVRRLMLAYAGRVWLAGGALGLGTALVLGRLAQALLVGVRASDPAVIGGAATIIGMVALAAGAMPARRAARVDPVVALRAE